MCAYQLVDLDENLRTKMIDWAYSMDSSYSKSQYKIIEWVPNYKTSEINYSAATPILPTSASLGTHEINNNTNQPVQKERGLKKKSWDSQSTTLTAGVKASAEIKLAVKTPATEAEGSYGVEISASVEKQTTTGTEREWTDNSNYTVPAHKKVIVEYTLAESTSSWTFDAEVVATGQVQI